MLSTHAILSEMISNPTMPRLSGRQIRNQYLAPLLAVCIVAGSVFFSGVIRQGSNKNQDSRYFYKAAECWREGHSPYDPKVYFPKLHAEFAGGADGGDFAYPPTFMLVIFPMAFFDRQIAAGLFSVMSFGAAMVLFWSCYRLLRESLSSPLGPVPWCWLTLASTMGSIALTIFFGQSSVFIAAACALALVGSKLNRSWLTVVGLIVATAKPQLSFPLLLFIPLFEPRQRKAAIIALTIILIPLAYSAMIDPHIVRSYMDIVGSNRSLDVNDPAIQIGIAGLL